MFQQRADLGFLTQDPKSGDLGFLFAPDKKPSNAPLLQSVFQNATGFALGAARGAALLPAGIERGLLFGVSKLTGKEPIVGPAEAFVARTYEAEADLQEMTGHPFVFGARGAGEFAGTILTAGKVLQGIEALGAGGAALIGGGAAEGAAFAAGDPRTDSPGFLGLGAALGVVGGAFAARSVARATQTLAAKGEGEAAAALSGSALQQTGAEAGSDIIAAAKSLEFSIPEGSARNVSIARENAQQTATLPDAIVGTRVSTNEAAVAGLRVQFSKLGKTGAAGTVRFVGAAPANLIEDLQATVGKDYSFRLLTEAERGPDAAGDLLVYAKGGKLSSEAIDAARKTGLLPGQMARLPSGDVIQIRNIAADGEHLMVSDPTTGSTFRIAASDVAGLDETLGHASLPDDAIEQWRSLRQAHPEESHDDIFKRLVLGYGDKLDAAAVPDLRSAITRSDVAAERAAVGQAESDLIDRFHTSLASLRQKASEGGAITLAEEAAAHGYGLSERSGGRYVLTSLPGRADAGISLPPFVGEAEARAFLRAESLLPSDLARLDLPPGLAETLSGAARSAPAAFDDASRNVEQAVEAADQARTTGRVGRKLRALGKSGGSNVLDPLIAPVRGLLARAAERLDRPDIFSVGFDAVNAASNRRRVAVSRIIDRVEKSGLAKLSPERRRVIDDYLSSNAPSVFAAQHSMTAKELGIARAVRSIFDDMFVDFSTSSGSSLSFSDFWRFYSPSITDEIQRTGTVDVAGFYRQRGLSVPNELRFFGEQFNTGELGWAPQADLVQKIVRTAHAGYFKAEVGPAWEQAAQLAKTIDDPFVRRQLIEYLAWTRGNASASVEGVRTALNQFFDDVGNVTGLQLSTGERRNILDMAYQGFYGAALGFRGGPVIRQVLQNYFLLAPMLRGGLARFARVQAALADPSLLTKVGLKGNEMYEWAVDASIIPRRTPVPLAETAERRLASGKALSYWDTINRKALQAFGNFDELNRTTAAIVYRDLLREDLPKLLDGSMTQTEFAHRTSLNMMGDAVTKGFFDTLSKDGAEEAVKFGARNFAEFGNFIYGSQNAPSWMRGGFGRLVGQLSTFPSGYVDLLRTVTSNGTKAQKARWFALHGLLGTSIAAAGSSAGVNLHSFVMWTTTGYSGGPWLQFGTNALTAYREGGAGSAAKFVAKNGPRYVLPASYFYRDLKLSAQALEDGNTEAAFFNLFGVREAPGITIGQQIRPKFPRTKRKPEKALPDLQF